MFMLAKLCLGPPPTSPKPVWLLDDFAPGGADLRNNNYFSAE